jgi:hypothetical protein
MNTGPLLMIMRSKSAVEQSVAQSTIWGFTEEAETGSHYLVDATDFLVRDAMQVTNRLKSNQQGIIHWIKAGRPFIYPDKNFPFNTELETAVTLSTAMALQAIM